MKHTLNQVFHSGKFVVGFTILVTTLLVVFIYPLFIKEPPLQIIGQGTFFPPGIYVSTYDTINAPTIYTLNLSDAQSRRIDNRLSQDDRVAMQEWLSPTACRKMRSTSPTPSSYWRSGRLITTPTCGCQG